MNTEKRARHLTVKVFYCASQVDWVDAALIFQDSSGGGAPRKVTIKIERPADIAYIRERLQDIEDGWRKSLDALKVMP